MLIYLILGSMLTSGVLVSSIGLAAKILLFWSPIFGTVFHPMCHLCPVMIVYPGIWCIGLSSHCCFFVGPFCSGGGARCLSVCGRNFEVAQLLVMCWQKPSWAGAAREILLDLFSVLGLGRSGIQGT